MCKTFFIEPGITPISFKLRRRPVFAVTDEETEIVVNNLFVKFCEYEDMAAPTLRENLDNISQTAVDCSQFTYAKAKYPRNVEDVQCFSPLLWREQFSSGDGKWSQRSAVYPPNFTRSPPPHLLREIG